MLFLFIATLNFIFSVYEPYYTYDSNTAIMCVIFGFIGMLGAAMLFGVGIGTMKDKFAILRMLKGNS